MGSSAAPSTPSAGPALSPASTGIALTPPALAAPSAISSTASTISGAGGGDGGVRDFSRDPLSSAGQGIGSWAAILLLIAVVAKRIKHREWIMLILVLLALAALTVGNLLKLGGPPLLVSWIVEVIVLASVVIWRGYEEARDRRVARNNAQILDDIAMKLGAGAAEPTITALLAELGNPKEPVQAVKTIAAERAALSTFLTTTRLDADLVRAAEGLAAERAQHAEADRNLTTFLMTAADLMKAAADLTAERARHAAAERSLSTFLTATGLDADLAKAAADLAAERARHAEADRSLTTFLTATGLDADLANAAADLAAERARHAAVDRSLSTFLSTAGLDDDLANAAEDLAEERARHAEAEQRSAAELTSLRLALKETIERAEVDKSNLDAALDAARSRILDLEAASRQPAVAKQVTADDARRFWTAEQSVRAFASPIVPGGGNHSCILPKKDGSAKMRLRFLVINMSPFDVRVTSIKFNFSAKMDAFQFSGEYNGPPGEQPDAVVKLAPWRQQHFVLRVKGTLANVANLSNKSTRIAYLYLHDNCYVTVSGHWDTPGRAPLMSDASYMLVSWEEFR
jgi:hypothetical protein